MQANPTEALLLRKRKAEDEVQKADAKRKLLADKYGDQGAVSAKPKTLAAGVEASEKYVEYDERGRIKGGGEEKRREKSMYAEHVLVNNHTSVWGSWWRDFKWGYACCHSIVKNSFCTGEAGLQAAIEAENFSKGLVLPETDEIGKEETIDEVGKEEAWKEEESTEKHVPNSQDTAQKTNLDESRRRIEELTSGVTEAEMEKYRKAKTNSNDPMMNMLGRDELLD
jgi:pre-mRNA-processing factor SLU7